MSNHVPKLLLLAVLSLSAGSAMADNWRNECGKMAASIPTACTEIEKTVAVLDVYKPPQPFVNVVLMQNLSPGSATGTSGGGSSSGGATGSILLDPSQPSTQGQPQDSGTW